MNLSGVWQFWMTPYEKRGGPGEAVSLPGSMDENKKGVDNTRNISTQYLNRDYLYAGPATYQKEVEIPGEWLGKRVVLCLERTKKTRVWLGGRPGIGAQGSYTTPQLYDLTACCKPGTRQTLSIEVDNSFAGLPQAMSSTFVEGEPWSHQVTEHTQTNWNGIIGKISLYAEPAVSISRLQLRPDIEKGQVRVKLEVRRLFPDAPLHGTVSLCAKSFNSTQPVHTAAEQRFPFDLPAGEEKHLMEFTYDMGKEFLLWDEFQPALYQMEASLFVGEEEQVLQAGRTQEFGMRRFTAGTGHGGRQFLINGRPTILRGEINCAVFPKTGYCPMGLDAWLHIFQIYREYGFNHVRFHTWVPPEAAFLAADRLGFYVYAELPHWGRRMFGGVSQGDFTDVEYYKEETKRIFDAYCNFPSFVMFALGNEERIGFSYYETFLKECRAMEPELLYSDIAGHSTYPPNADFAAKYINPGYLPQIREGNNWDFTEAVSAAPVPITGHEVGQLQVYPDYARELPKYASAVLKPRNLEHFREVLSQAGIAGDAAKFSHATGGLNGMLTRSFTEAYLRTSGAGGFTLLGLQDFSGQGTALVGLLDAFLESKGIMEPEEFRQSCAALTVLARMERFVWEEGETFSAQVVVPNYTAHDVTASVRWSLESPGNGTVASGELPSRRAEQGGVTSFGEISAPLGAASAPQRLLLKLTLCGAYADPLSPGTNHYDIWRFPAPVEPELPEDVLLCRSYNEEADRALAAGKTVLLISEGTAEALPLSREVSFRPDFWSPMFHTPSPDGYSLGVWIQKESALFRDFPVRDFGDWQWLPVLNGARGVLLNGLPSSLQPMVQPIATIDLPERLAAIFEARVHTGRLLACTLDLLGKRDTVSRSLLCALCRYVSGGFASETALEPGELRKRFPPLELVRIQPCCKEHLAVGEQVQIQTQCFNSKGSCEMPAGTSLRYESSAPGLLSVSETGVVRGLKSGAARLVITAEAGGASCSAEMRCLIGQAEAEPLPLDGAQFFASSSCKGFPASNLGDGRPDTFWVSDYKDKNCCMPQSVLIRFPCELKFSSLLCCAPPNHPRGAVLRACVEVSVDGEVYQSVCTREWEDAGEPANRYFSFPTCTARFIRIKIEQSVMFTGDTNAAAISECKLYHTPCVASVENPDVIEVRFGTPLETIRKRRLLPERVRIMRTDGIQEEAEVLWGAKGYQPEISGDYPLSGLLFTGDAANPGGVVARQILRVLPKNTGSPPDKSKLDARISQLRALRQKDYTAESWEELQKTLEQAACFYALTGAVQHDADVWEDELRETYGLLKKSIL